MPTGKDGPITPPLSMVGGRESKKDLFDVRNVERHAKIFQKNTTIPEPTWTDAELGEQMAEIQHRERQAELDKGYSFPERNARGSMEYVRERESRAAIYVGGAVAENHEADAVDNILRQKARAEGQGADMTADLQGGEKAAEIQEGQPEADIQVAESIANISREEMTVEATGDEAITEISGERIGSRRSSRVPKRKVFFDEEKEESKSNLTPSPAQQAPRSRKRARTTNSKNNNVDKNNGNEQTVKEKKKLPEELLAESDAWESVEAVRDLLRKQRIMDVFRTLGYKLGSINRTMRKPFRELIEPEEPKHKIAGGLVTLLRYGDVARPAPNYEQLDDWDEQGMVWGRRQELLRRQPLITFFGAKVEAAARGYVEPEKEQEEGFCAKGIKNR